MLPYDFWIKRKRFKSLVQCMYVCYVCIYVCSLLVDDVIISLTLLLTGFRIIFHLSCAFLTLRHFFIYHSDSWIQVGYFVYLLIYGIFQLTKFFIELDGFLVETAVHSITLSDSLSNSCQVDSNFKLLVRSTSLMHSISLYT